MIRETGVQSKIESYQRLEKWYLMPPCLALSIIRYGSRVKWVNPGKGEAPSRRPWRSSYWKGSLRVALDYGRQFNFYFTKYRKLHSRESKVLVHAFFRPIHLGPYKTDISSPKLIKPLEVVPMVGSIMVDSALTFWTLLHSKGY